MVLQYAAVGIQSAIRTCYKRADYRINLEWVADSIGRAVSRAELDLPVRLVALTEGALGGWAHPGGEEHIKACEYLAPEIPGEETEFLGALCKEMDFYLIGQMQAKDNELMKDRMFNIAFIIDPKGKVIHKHYKTACFPLENMTCPSDIWDVYLEKYGDDPVRLSEALFPVARTEIGNIGTLVCAEGSYPEAARGLALNGAEIIWRGAYPEPWIGNNMFEIQNRSHAIFNTCYVLAPNPNEVCGSLVDHKDSLPTPLSMEHRVSYGRSQIIDYRGNIVSETLGTGESWVSAIFNIDGLRDYRVRGLWQNLVKDMRIEQYKVIYDAIMAKGGLFPSNLYLEEPPLTVPDQGEVFRNQVNRAVELGIYTPPPGWKPRTIKREVLERIEKAKKRR